MDKMIEVEGLKKYYSDVKAVDGIDFYVETGKLFAFLGPNGAGKSTTIDIICTFLKPDEGKVLIDGNTLGKDDAEIREVIGAVFQDGVLDDLLSIEENLKTRGAFYGLKGDELDNAVKNATEVAGISDLLKRRYGKLSGGQRRRADIARALVHTPKILFLDEPTTGLDPQTRQSVWQTIRTLQKETGMTIFLTTHYMEEAADADYVIVIDHGIIAAKGTPDGLRERYAKDMLRLYPKNADGLETLLQTEGLSFDRKNGRYDLVVETTMDAIPLIETLQSEISGFEVLSGTMDDAFIGITGKEIRE